MNTIRDIRPYSIKPNDGFMWVAELMDEGVKNEYEINGFDIDRKKLINFGIVGLANRMFYEIPTGIFNLNSRRLEFSIMTDEGLEYELTNNYGLYNDCICYHNFWQNLNDPSDPTSHFCGYSFGYKRKLNLSDFELNFQPILVVNYNDVPYYKFRFVCSENLKGKLLIKVNKQYGITINIDLEKNVSSEYEYYLR